MTSYLELLRTPKMARLITTQLIARLPTGMMALAMLLHIQRESGSYTAAGAVVGAVSLGQAAATPAVSRCMLRYGMRPVLLISTVLNAAALATIAVLPMPVWAAVITGMSIGATTPPVQPAFRAAAPQLIAPQHHSRLFAFDASVQEIIWIAGPVLAALIASATSPGAALLASAATLIAGGFTFACAPGLALHGLPPGGRKFGAVLREPAVLLTATVAGLLVASNAATEAALVATFGASDPSPGIALAIWSASSLIGGLAFGSRPVGPATLGLRMAGVTAGTALLLLAWDFWSLTVFLMISGLAIAPAGAAMFAIVATRLQDDSVIEAYGWIATAQRVGFGLGSVAAGWAIDNIGAEGAFWTATTFAVIGTILPVLYNGMTTAQDP